MTQDEIIEIAREAGFKMENSAALQAAKAFYKLIAAKALAQPEQEPVGRFAKFTDGVWRPVTEYSAGVPLYTHPAQRTWVGLSNEDWKEIEDMPDTFDQGVAWAQRRLKEKNT